MPVEFLVDTRREGKAIDWTPSFVVTVSLRIQSEYIRHPPGEEVRIDAQCHGLMAGVKVRIPLSAEERLHVLAIFDVDEAASNERSDVGILVGQVVVGLFIIRRMEFLAGILVRERALRESNRGCDGIGKVDFE